MTDDLIVERDGPVALVSLNRPDRLNALSASLLDALRETWRELAGDGSLRCVIVTGRGRGFCAGADLELLAGERTDMHEDVHEELAFLPGAALPVPVIAAVNGPCAGAGLHFVADADIAIASRSATFSDPHVSVGQVSALEPLTLALRMRPDVLRRMVLLGVAGRLDAEAALAAELISEVVDDDSLLTRAQALAAAVAEGSPAAVAASRAILRALEAKLIGDSLQAGWDALRAHRAHPDALEGPAARIERRAPRWAAP
jgi:enoyl-CoA hydratase/carnithine racemase